MTDLPVIYLYIAERGIGWVRAVALAQDGMFLARVTSSAEKFVRSDMEKQAKRFLAHYPKGFRTEWVQHPEAHDGVQAALKFKPLALTVQSKLREIRERVRKRGRT